MNERIIKLIHSKIKEKGSLKKRAQKELNISVILTIITKQLFINVD